VTSSRQTPQVLDDPVLESDHQSFVSVVDPTTDAHVNGDPDCTFTGYDIASTRNCDGQGTTKRAVG
jgi:hypothetical protein